MKKIDTRLSHVGNRPREHSGIINPPVYHASTVAYDSLQDLRDRFRSDDPRAVTYGRHGTPTTFALEEAATELDGGHGAIAVSSGLAAISLALMTWLRPGDHLLVSDTVYAPVRSLCDQVLSTMDVACEYFDPLIGEDIGGLLRDTTRVVYMESPGSHTFELHDVPAIMGALAGSNVVTIFDNTWATPLLFRPLDHGIDISLQAATKYYGGHSDLMMGIVVCNERTHAAVKRYRDLVGHCAAPDDAYLALRGIRTLGVRIERHQANALALARWLETRPEVRRVIHPGLPSHPQHDIFRRDFSGSSGLFSLLLEPCSETALAAMLDGMELFSMGFSWGGYESLMIPYDINRHRSVRPLDDPGILLRIHAGLEKPEDLIADLDAGFARLASAGG